MTILAHHETLAHDLKLEHDVLCIGQPTFHVSSGGIPHTIRRRNAFSGNERTHGIICRYESVEGPRQDFMKIQWIYGGHMAVLLRR